MNDGNSFVDYAFLLAKATGALNKTERFASLYT